MKRRERTEELNGEKRFRNNCDRQPISEAIERDEREEGEATVSRPLSNAEAKWKCQPQPSKEDRGEPSSYFAVNFQLSKYCNPSMIYIKSEEESGGSHSR
jgi:hypothetical protein